VGIEIDKRIILCDFDGTITTRDITNTLCRAFIPERWAEVEQLWETGVISATECYELEYEALGFRRQGIDAFLLATDIDPGTGRLLQAARELGWEFLIVSAGFDYYIETVLGRHGLSAPYVANYLYFDEGGVPRFDFLAHDDPECRRFKHPCAGCKPLTFDAWKAKGYRIAFVGDGSTDFCMAEHFAAKAGPGDLLFAKTRLLDYCRQQGVPAIPYDTLADVAEVIRDS